MLSLHTNALGRISSLLRKRQYKPLTILPILFLVMFGGIGIKMMAHAETSTVGSLVTTYSEGSNYVNEDISGKNFQLSVIDGTIATLHLDAEFAPGQNKKISVKVPTGLSVKSYSATTDTTEMSGVTKVEIDGAYKDYVLSSSLSAATSNTHILDGEGNQVKFPADTAWESQVITGYSKLASSNDENLRTYGGDLEWILSDETTKLELVLTVSVQNEILTHMSATEALNAIQIKMSSDQGDITQDCNITATGVQNFTFPNRVGSTGYPGTLTYNINAESEIENRSEQFAIMAGTNCSNASGVVTMSQSLSLLKEYPLRSSSAFRFSNP